MEIENTDKRRTKNENKVRMVETKRRELEQEE